MNVVRVPWSSASFLVYLGGITILFATVTLLSSEAESRGSVGLVLWAFLIFAAVSFASFVARERGNFVTAGLLAASTVAAFIVFLGSVLDWFGWLPNLNEEGLFDGFRFWLLVLELTTVIAFAVALQIHRFPLLVLLLAGSIWFFVADLLSGGGNWTAIVTIAVGLAFLLAGIAVDDGPSRPYGFWLHVAAGATIGGGLVWFFHDGDFDWILIALAGLLFIALGDRLGRSSWVVLAGWGILQTAAHFADKWSDPASFGGILFFPLFPFVTLSGFEEGSPEIEPHAWAGPVSFAVAGVVFIGIAIFLARRSRPPIAEI